MRIEVWTDESGAALLEAMLVLPVLLVLVFGLLDVSLYLWNSALAGKAAQLGLRQAVVSDAVAVGPGLEAGESAAYWRELPPGLRCFPEPGGRSPCPGFAVTCGTADGCTCRGDACGFRFSAARLRPLLSAMQAVLPDLAADNVRVSYATNGLGYVQRPGPVPVDVRVSLTGLHYRPLFLGSLLGSSLPLRGSASMQGESLTTLR